MSCLDHNGHRTDQASPRVILNLSVSRLPSGTRDYVGSITYVA